MSGLVHLYYHDDAEGPVARFAGMRASREAMSSREAEEIRRACPNGAQMESREVTS